MRSKDALPAELRSAPSTEAHPASGVSQSLRTDVPLIDARTVLARRSDAALPDGAWKQLRDVAQWFEDFLNRAHPLLGRSGEVCPWTKRTLDLGKLLLAPITSDNTAEVDHILRSLRKEFLSTEPTKGPDAAFRSVVAVFHGLERAHEAAFVVATHERLKPEFLDCGLMLGEFYPSCPKPGLRSSAFRPLRSPVPLLVIRPMVEPDIEFLLDRDEFVAAYLRTHRGRGRERFLRVLEQRPATVSPERIPTLLSLAEEYRDSSPPSRRSSPFAS
jgi:hypothetical protein